VNRPSFRKAVFACAALCGAIAAASAQAADGAAPRAEGPKIPQGRYVASTRTSAPAGGVDASVGKANLAARVEPTADGFFNAIQRWPWSEGALYQVYAAPGQVTDIALQPGELLTGTGPVAAGDTARWIIGDTESGAGETKRIHILIKPVAPGLVTNMVINTDRRTYHLELRATGGTYMAAVSWIYPQDALIALKARPIAAAVASVEGPALDVASLRFDYRILGDRPAWRPERVFDDGRRTFIAFPPQVRQGELPPIYALGAGGGPELVNYRVDGAYVVVDRLFEVAELRLGDKRGAKVVRIVRGASDSRR